MKLWKKILIGILVAFIGVIALAIIVSPKAEELPVPEFTSPAGTEERVDEISNKAKEDSKSITIENAKYCKQYLIENYGKDLESDMYYSNILYWYGEIKEDVECVRAGSIARKYAKYSYLDIETMNQDKHDKLIESLGALDF